MTLSTTSNKDASEKSLVTLWKNSLDDYAEIVYQVSVPQDGLYNLTGITSVVSSNLTSDFFLQFNDGIKYEAKNADLISDLTYDGLSGIMKQYDFGNFPLKKGVNQFKVIIDVNDRRSDGLYIAYFDCFNLQLCLQGTENIKMMALEPSEELGVYQEDEEVAFNYEISNFAATPETFYYTLTDVWQNPVKTDSFTINSGEYAGTLDLGQLDTGWYTLEVFSDEAMQTSADFKTNFSVIQDTEKRTAIADTPFAVDFPSTYYFKSLSEVEKNAKVLSDIGIKWIRNREVALHSYNGADDQRTHKDIFFDNGISVLDCCGTWGSAGEMTMDLLQVYNGYKKYAQDYNGKPISVEILNEMDGTKDVTGDLYSAYLKAAAVGISDGDSNMYKSFGGLTGGNDTEFMKLSLSSGIMDYVDSYNFHYHTDSGANIITPLNYGGGTEAVIASQSYDLEKPLWLTEGGVSMFYDKETEEVPYENLITQARYYITASASECSYGVDKTFWFLWNKYLENNSEWGSYSAKKTPNPVVNTISTLTYQLGKGKYIGTLTDLPTETYGYMFDNGENDVAVLWGDSVDVQKQWTIYSESDVIVSDMMGKETVYSPNNNLVIIPVGFYPVFVKFNNKSDVSNYLIANLPERNINAGTYDLGDRVVLQPIWDGQDYEAAKRNGYIINSDEPQKVTLNIYNFNDVTVSGTVQILCDDVQRFAVSDSSIPFTVEPNSKYVAEVYVSMVNANDFGYESYVTFNGTINGGEKVSPTVAKICSVQQGRTVDDYTVLLTSTSQINKANRGGGSVTVNKTLFTNEFSFDYDFTSGGSWWGYPIFTLPNGTNLESTSGICFYAKSEEADSKTGVGLYVYSDTGNYYTGLVNAIPLTDEWTQIVIPWNKLEGTGLNLAGITKISVGAHFGTDNPAKYYLKDVAYYTSDDPRDAFVDAQVITISGADNNETYPLGTSFNIEALLPEGNYSNVKVAIQNQLTNNFTKEGNKVSIPIGHCERGEYHVQVTAVDENQIAITKRIVFYVD